MMDFIHVVDDALSLDACAEMIKAFEAHPEEQVPGVISGGISNPDLKRSTDLKLVVYGRTKHWKTFDAQLFTSAGKVLRNYPHRNWMRNDMGDTGYQIQRTNEDEFYGLHYDTDGKGIVALRQLVIIWYLNDVEEGGNTMFPNQQVTIRPKAGRAVAFPPFWTHQHEGQPVLKGSKYIATTWIIK